MNFNRNQWLVRNLYTDMYADMILAARNTELFTHIRIATQLTVLLYYLLAQMLQHTLTHISAQPLQCPDTSHNNNFRLNSG